MASFFDSDMKAALGMGLTFAAVDLSGFDTSIRGAIGGIVAPLAGSWADPISTTLYVGLIGWAYMKWIEPSVRQM